MLLSDSMVPAAVTSRVFGILADRRATVEATLDKLNKRAQRKGLPLLSFSWGKAYTETMTQFFESADDAPVGARFIGSNHERTHGQYSFEVVRIPLTIVGDVPKYAGWTFLAALQHIEGGTIVRAVPGQECPPVYRDRGPHCDHCRANRRRNDTYVVRHESGRTMQVGSTCIAAFLGSDEAGRIADRATLIAEACDYAGSEEGFSGGGGVDTRSLSEYLEFCAYEIRTNGWVSRTTARERGGAASADRAWGLMTDRKKRQTAKITDDDRAKAAHAEEWANAITDETLSKERSDYLSNVRVVARSGLATFRTAGIAASIITAYERAEGKKRQDAQCSNHPAADSYVGQPKGKITMRVTLAFVGGYESAYGYQTVLKFRTAEGATLVWKTSSPPDVGRADAGKTFTLSGTVKAHEVYKGEKQTTVLRCKLVALSSAVAA